MPSFLRSTPSILQRSSMLEVFSETSTIASSIYTNDTGISSEHSPDSSDEMHDPSAGGTDTEAWEGPPKSQCGNVALLDGSVDEGSQASQQSVELPAEANVQLYSTSCSSPGTRCSSFSNPQVSETQYCTEEGMTPSILPANVTATESQADAPGPTDEPRGEVVNQSKRFSISPFSPTGPQSGVQDTAVLTLARSREDPLHQFTLMLSGTIRAHVALEHPEMPCNTMNPASPDIGSDSRAESAVIDRLASILGRYSCS